MPILQDIDRGRRRLGRQVHRICKSDDTKLTNVGLSSSDSRRGAEEIAVSKASNLESSARTHSLYGPPSSRYTVQTSGDGAPPGYRREGNYYVPISSAQKPTRSQPSTYGSTNSTGPLPQPIRMENNRDPRDLLRNLRDPRDPRDPRDSKASTKIQDYPLDPRYAYPSPAATMTGSVISYNRSVVSQIPR